MQTHAASVWQTRLASVDQKRRLAERVAYFHRLRPHMGQPYRAHVGGAAGGKGGVVVGAGAGVIVGVMESSSHAFGYTTPARA
jgi:hypothetical protein